MHNYDILTAANQLHNAGYGGFGSYTVLRSKPQEHTQQRKDPCSGKVVGKYHYHHPKAARLRGGMQTMLAKLIIIVINTGTSIRKLGKTKPPNFFVGNAS